MSKLSYLHAFGDVIVEEVRMLLSRLEVTQVVHMSRECNMVAIRSLALVRDL